MRIRGSNASVRAAVKEVEPGARAMMLLQEGCFRLDVQLSGDTLRTIVRNLSAGELELTGRSSGGGAALAFGEVDALSPAHATMGFTLTGAGGDRLAVSVTLATLQVPARGTVRVAVQAILRETAPTGEYST